MKKAFSLLFLSIVSIHLCSQTNLTPFERSGEKETATYFEAISFYKQLDAKYDNIVVKAFDTTDAGYPLHLVLFSSDKHFNPTKWFEQDKIVIMINNGIHPGEPDGIDASMMFLRDVAVGKIKAPANGRR